MNSNKQCKQCPSTSVFFHFIHSFKMQLIYFDFISFYYYSILCSPPNIIETRLFNFTHKVKMTGLFFATSVQISTLLTNWSHGKLKTVGSDSAGLTQSESLNVNSIFIFSLPENWWKCRGKMREKILKVYSLRPLLSIKVCLEKYQTFEKIQAPPALLWTKKNQNKTWKEQQNFLAYNSSE